MKLNPIFRSHMVFAVGKPIRIYGEGAGKVEISFAAYSKFDKCSYLVSGRK